MESESPDEEPFGITPLPISVVDINGDSGIDFASSPVEIFLDMDPIVDPMNGIAQHPQTQQIAVYEPTPNEECINGCLLDVNPHFVVYAVKNGLIRVLHRHSAMRALLRGHAGQKLTDIRFFQDGDVLGTIGSNGGNSTLIIWRVFEQSPEIQSEKLLEVSSSEQDAPGLLMSRLVWHPFSPNQFWMLHSTTTNPQVATLVESTRIQTRLSDPEDSVSQHPICQWPSPYCVMDGAVQLKADNGKLTDLAWSGRDARHVLTVHDNGTIILWDLRQKSVRGLIDTNSEDMGDDFTIPKKLCVLEEEERESFSRCCFINHDFSLEQAKMTSLKSETPCFVTASHQNSVVTLWSAFTSVNSITTGNIDFITPTKLQVIHMVPHPKDATPTSFVVDACWGPTPPNSAPPSCFLLVGSRQKGRMFALHVRSEWSSNRHPQQALCVGVDYVVPFVLKHAIYSWCVVCSPTQDIAEEELGERAGLIFDMKCFSYQSKLVQCLTLTSYMCLPPQHGYENKLYQGIWKVQPLMGKYVPSSSTSMDAGGEERGSRLDDYIDDYDVDDDDELDYDVAATSAAAEPAAGSLLPGSVSSALAQNPFANWLGAIAGVNVTANNPPLPPMPTERDVTADASASLSPMEILAGAGASVEPAVEVVIASNPTPSVKPLQQIKPKKQNIKGQNKSPKRSKSPKGRKNQQDKTPFPDGKVTILKREANTPTAVATQPPPPDPSMVSDPTLMAAAGIPLAPPPPTPVTIDTFVLESQVTRAVEQTMNDMVVPAVNKSIQESFATLARPLRTSMDNLSKQGVTVDQDALKNALDIEAPLKAAVADTVRTVLVPSLEAVVGQVLKQVQESMRDPPPDHSKTLEMLSQQLISMNAKMEAMTKEVRDLRQAISSQIAAHANRGASPQQPLPSQSAGGSPYMDPSATQAMQLEQARTAITTLLQQGNYEAAFTKAVSSSTADMTLFCCSRAGISQVFGGSAPKLSQPILLCVMQQLAAALATTTNPNEVQIELSWLQEIALSLNPREPSIQRHVPSVLQILVNNINGRIMAEGTNANGQLRRQLQMLLQILRGIQMG